MTTFSLFGDNNMAAVTSCAYVLITVTVTTTITITVIIIIPSLANWDIVKTYREMDLNLVKFPAGEKSYERDKGKIQIKHQILKTNKHPVYSLIAKYT